AWFNSPVTTATPFMCRFGGRRLIAITFSPSAASARVSAAQPKPLAPKIRMEQRNAVAPEQLSIDASVASGAVVPSAEFAQCPIARSFAESTIGVGVFQVA